MVGPEEENIWHKILTRFPKNMLWQESEVQEVKDWESLFSKQL